MKLKNTLKIKINNKTKVFLFLSIGITHYRFTLIQNSKNYPCSLSKLQRCKMLLTSKTKDTVVICRHTPDKIWKTHTMIINKLPYMCNTVAATSCSDATWRLCEERKANRWLQYAHP